MSNEKVPKAESQDALKRYINAMRNILARTISKLAEKIGTDETKDARKARQDDFNASRRAFLKGSAALLTTQTKGGTRVIVQETGSMPIENWHLSAVSRLLEHREALDVLVDISDGYFFDALQKIRNVVNSPTFKQMSWNDWHTWLVEEGEALLNAEEFIFGLIDEKMPIEDILDPTVQRILEETAMFTAEPEELQEALSTFKTLGGLQDHLRREYLQIYTKMIKLHRDNPNNEFLQKCVLEIYQTLHKHPHFMYWAKRNGYQEIVKYVSKFADMKKYKIFQKEFENVLERLKKDGVSTIEVNNNCIITSNYSNTRNFIRSSFGKGVKRFALHALGSSEARSIENKKYIEFGKEFAEVQKESPNAFVKVIIYYD